jgi:hypothetical protein
MLFYLFDNFKNIYRDMTPESRNSSLLDNGSVNRLPRK